MTPERDLGPDGQRFWDAVTADFEFDAAEAWLLTEACCTLDDITSLQGEKSVSGIREVRQLRLAFSRLLDKLGLPYDEEGGLTPAQKRGKKAAESRWKNQTEARKR